MSLVLHVLSKSWITYLGWVYLEGNHAVSIRKGWIECMPTFIAVARTTPSWSAYELFSPPSYMYIYHFIYYGDWILHQCIYYLLLIFHFSLYEHIFKASLIYCAIIGIQLAKLLSEIKRQFYPLYIAKLHYDEILYQKKGLRKYKSMTNLCKFINKMAYILSTTNKLIWIVQYDKLYTHNNS